MMRQPKIAVLLAGSGVFDGSELHEAVFTLLHLEKGGADYQCFAPDIDQAHVINHLTGDVSEGEQRNVLVESARIARGEIQALSEAVPSDFDAVAVPGGFGVAKNLCDFAFKGPDMQVNQEVLNFLQKMNADGKPIGLFCIAPALGPKVATGAQVTIGNDEGTAAGIEALGGQHQVCQVGEVCVDTEHRMVTTPAYMLANSISDAHESIQAGVEALLDMVREIA